MEFRHYSSFLTCIIGCICWSLPLAYSCHLRNLGNGNLVCVCNATYCDTVPSLPMLSKWQVATYTSSQSGLRLHLRTTVSSSMPNGGVVFEVKKNSSRQTIFGFGGAFTDAAGINIHKLPIGAQINLLKSYFSNKGIEYTIGRVPMASCDYSIRQYSYDDCSGDFRLKHFALAPEDLTYKIPYIQKAISLSSGKLKLFASPWSAPYWMKTNQNMSGNGTLIGRPGGRYYKTWANYFVCFLKAYQKHNISFWGLTAQNEPTDGYIYNHPFQAMGFLPALQRDFIKLDLGPALHASNHSHVKLMILDDNRLLLPYWANKVLKDSEAASYISGIGVHWYIDEVSPLAALDITHAAFPDKFILATEATVKEVVAGVWEHAQSYASDILDDLNHWVTGWVDWNIALSMSGGPNWAKIFDNSPILVNASAAEFYKQPMFYALGHFSKFISPGSTYVVMRAKSSSPYIKSACFMRPDSLMTAVFLNMARWDQHISIQDGDRYINIALEAMSIKSVIWK